jgi:hypothetical protein
MGSVHHLEGLPSLQLTMTYHLQKGGSRALLCFQASQALLKGTDRPVEVEQSNYIGQLGALQKLFNHVVLYNVISGRHWIGVLTSGSTFQNSKMLLFSVPTESSLRISSLRAYFTSVRGEYNGHGSRCQFRDLHG